MAVTNGTVDSFFIEKRTMLLRKASQSSSQFRPHVEAEDIVQDTYTRLRKYDGDRIRNLSSLVYTSLMNTIFSEALTAKRWKQARGNGETDLTREEYLEQEIRTSSATDKLTRSHVDEKHIIDGLFRQEASRILMNALNKLDSERAEYIRLHHLEGCSYEEIVKMKGVPLGTVKSNISRGMKDLRKELGSLERYL